MDQHAGNYVPLELNNEIDVEALAETFRAKRRAHIPQFLTPASAAALYHYCNHRIPYRTFIVANEKQLGTAPGAENALSPEEEREALGIAYEGAKSGFASALEPDRLLADEIVRTNGFEETSLLIGPGVSASRQMPAQQFPAATVDDEGQHPPAVPATPHTA